MDLALESEGFDPDSHFTFWKPGTVPEPEPKGMAWRLDRDTDLVLNLHLRPSGKPESVAPLIGLYFTDEAPTLHPMLLQLEHDGAIDLPPGTKDVTITDELVLPVAVDVLAVYPHAHYLGKEIEGTATLPDGTIRWLVHIKDWDVNWQAVYRLVEPVFLPAGTTVRMRWSYDNTEDNIRNPSRPPRRVRAGNRAEDEMGHLWLQVLPRSESPAPSPAPLRPAPAPIRPRPRSLPPGPLLLPPPPFRPLPICPAPTIRVCACRKPSMRRRITKYPADFTAHYNLGAALQAQGRLDEAVKELREAVRLGPTKATAPTPPRGGAPGPGQERRSPRRVPGRDTRRSDLRQRPVQPRPGPARPRPHAGGPRSIPGGPAPEARRRGGACPARGSAAEGGP